MKTYKQFITEGTTPELSAHQFPLIGTLPRAHNYVTELLSILNPALVAGEILNPVFTTAKDRLSRLTELVQHHIAEKHYNSGKYASLPPKIYTDIELTMGYPNNIEGKMKKLEKVITDHPVKAEYLAFAKELMILVRAMESLKPHIVKRITRTPEELAALEKEKFHQKLASVPALKAVSEVLTKMTDEVKHQYAKDVTDHFMRLAEKFVNEVQHEEQFLKRREGGAWGTNAQYAQKVMNAYGFVIQIMCDKTPGATVWEPETYKLKVNYRAVAEKEGNEAANFMQKEFLHKNVNKLCNVLDMKGNLQGEPKILSIHASRGMIEGDIRFEFADGSGFKVRNKIILKYSIYGKPFNQYPTTFHDVVLPGGKPMSQPSEERMVTVFAATKAE